MKLKERILEKLTIWYLRFGNARFEKKINYTYGSYSKDVFIFSSKTKRNAQATPWETIIISDVVFEKYSKNVVDLFFLHEYGHTKVNIILKLLFYFSIIPLFLLFIGSVLALIMTPIILLLKETEPFAVFLIFISNLLLTMVLSLMIMIISWASEIHAEVFAIKTMGKKNYLEAIQESKREKRKRNLLSRAFYRLRYPPHRFTMFFYERSK